MSAYLHAVRRRRQAVAATADRVDARIGLAVVAAASIGAFAIESVAWRTTAGRNLTFYLSYYLDMAHRHPVLPTLMLTIKPLPAIVFGPLLQFTGATGTTIACALMYAVSISAYTAIAARLFDRLVAGCAAVALLLYPPYAALFHQPSGDALFAFAMSLWGLLLVRLVERPSYRLIAWQAPAVFLLVMTRTANQMLAVVALCPLLLIALPWRRRLLLTGALVAAVAVGVLAVDVYDGARYGDYTSSRTANANFPLYRVFAFDHLVTPSNGPATRELARAVQNDLLQRQPYKAYHVTLNEFFADASPRFWSDLVLLSDRTWGWNSNYTKLRAVAIEAIRAHPRAYAHDVYRSVLDQFSEPVFTGVAQAPAKTPPGPAATVVVDGRKLPQPSEGQPIPAANMDWTLATPHQTITMDWSSISHPVVRFADPALAKRDAHIVARRNALLAKLGNANGSPSLARLLNRIEHLYPPLWAWLLVGALGFAIRRPRGAAGMFTLLLVALTVVVGSAVGQPFTPAYRIPFDPIFILFGIAGVLAPAGEKPGGATV